MHMQFIQLDETYADVLWSQIFATMTRDLRVLYNTVSNIWERIAMFVQQQKRDYHLTEKKKRE